VSISLCLWPHHPYDACISCGNMAARDGMCIVLFVKGARQPWERSTAHQLHLPLGTWQSLPLTWC
jgi:hypothetical protein